MILIWKSNKFIVWLTASVCSFRLQLSSAAVLFFISSSLKIIIKECESNTPTRFVLLSSTKKRFFNCNRSWYGTGPEELCLCLLQLTVWYVTVVHYIHNRDRTDQPISTHIRESTIEITRTTTGQYRCQSSQLDMKLWKHLEGGRWCQLKLKGYPRTRSEREERVAIAMENVNKSVKWAMSTNNCEHFINRVLTGRPISLQVEKEKARLLSGLATSVFSTVSAVAVVKGLLVASGPIVIGGGVALVNSLVGGSILADQFRSGRRHYVNEETTPTEGGDLYSEAIELSVLQSSLDRFPYSGGCNRIVWWPIARCISRFSTVPTIFFTVFIHNKCVMDRLLKGKV